jgi:hypothetical protein
VETARQRRAVSRTDPYDDRHRLVHAVDLALNGWPCSVEPIRH